LDVDDHRVLLGRRAGDSSGGLVGGARRGCVLADSSGELDVPRLNLREAVACGVEAEPRGVGPKPLRTDAARSRDTSVPTAVPHVESSSAARPALFVVGEADRCCTPASACEVGVTELLLLGRRAGAAGHEQIEAELLLEGQPQRPEGSGAVLLDPLAVDSFVLVAHLASLYSKVTHWPP